MVSCKIVISMLMRSNVDYGRNTKIGENKLILPDEWLEICGIFLREEMMRNAKLLHNFIPRN